MIGICAYGAYVPWHRMDRKLIHDAIGWINPATVAYAKGQKAVANFDEDSLTMAVAAGIDCLKGHDRSLIQGIYLASTTLPYKERLNAGIVSTALAFNEHIRAADFSGGLKCATSALLSAIEGVESKRLNNLMVCASDCRLGKPGSSQEMIFGDAAAAFMIGDRDVVAEFKGSYSTTYDFVDHYRGEFAKYDRQWEDRWIRDFGFEYIIPETIRGFLKKYRMKMTDFRRVVYPCHYAAERKKLNRLLNISPEAEQGNLMMEIGDAGSAQQLVMLSHALETGRPGDKILLLGFGNGCDALYFQLTDNIKKNREMKGVSGHLAQYSPMDNYTKYLVWRKMLAADLGPKGEEDQLTRWSFHWRKRKAILGLWGSRCTGCGTVQYPPQRICVNPDCGAVDEMEDFLFSDKTGHITDYTGDNLAPSNDPPAIYGTVQFEMGGRHTFDFTDCDLDALAVGLPVEMSFRRRTYDRQRDVSGYFWKAVPMKGGK